MGILDRFRRRKKIEYKFTEREDTACFSCAHVVSGDRPILYATRDGDGAWQFHCGADDHTVENAKLISLKQVTDLDDTVNSLWEMPLNVGAKRSTAKDKWVPFRLAQ